MENLYTVKEENATLHISKGNNKIGKGIYAFSSLPGNEEHRPVIKDKGYVVNIPGTCSKYCNECAKDGACYAWRDLKLHHNVTAMAWGENTLLLRSGLVFDMIDNYINKKNAKYYKSKKDKDLHVRTWRINVSGELEDLKQLNGWNNLALKHPEVNFGIYTKNYDVLDEFLSNGGHIADNFVINISQWNHVADDFLRRHPGEFNVFEYDETNKKTCTWSQEDRERLSKISHCPAVDIKGHHAKTKDGKDITCDMCKRCYRKTGAHTAVYSH